MMECFISMQCCVKQVIITNIYLTCTSSTSQGNIFFQSLWHNVINVLHELEYTSWFYFSNISRFIYLLVIDLVSFIYLCDLLLTFSHKPIKQQEFLLTIYVIPTDTDNDDSPAAMEARQEEAFAVHTQERIMGLLGAMLPSKDKVAIVSFQQFYTD